MKNSKYIFIAFLLSSSGIFAQDDLPTGEVEVVKDFEARVADTKRLNVAAKIPESQTSSKTYNYTVSSKQLEVSYEAPILKPLSMPTERNPEAYKGFLKAGYGYPSSLYGELGYVHSFGSRKKSASRSRPSAQRGASRNSSSRGVSSSAGGGTVIGIHLLHHSADNTSKFENQKFSQTGGRLHFKTQMQQGFSIFGEASYEMNNRFFYGYNQDSISFTEEEAKRSFQTIGAKFGLFNSQENALGIDYNADVSFYNHSDALEVYENKETGILLQLGASKYLAEKQKLGVDVETDYTNYIPDCAVCDFPNQELTNFSLSPYVNLFFGPARVDIGAKLASSDGEFDFFPDVEISAKVAGSKFIAYAGADGGYQKNTFRSLTDYNPFVAPTIDSLFNSEVRNYYGGLKGQIKSFSYEGRVSYKQVKDQVLYLNKETDRRYFRALADDVDVLSIGGTVKADVTSYLSAAVSINQNIYSLEVEAEPWHLPSFEANASVKFISPNQKILVKGELFLEDAVPYINELGEVAQTSTLFDINVGAEYFVTKNIGLFVDLNNLAASERQRWSQYPQLGLNVLGGVTARF